MQARSTGIRNLDADAYKDIVVPIAPMEQQRRIMSILEAEHASIMGHKNGIQTLSIQKNALARKLFSGNLRLDEQFDLEALAPQATLSGGAA
jgi:restriction endonuclease S subunit